MILILIGLFGTALQVHSKAFAYIPFDPGNCAGSGCGPGVFGGDSPAPNSGRYNPTCGTATNACFTSGQTITPYYVVGNNNQDYSYSYMTLAVYVQRQPAVSMNITILNAAGDCHNAPSGGTGLVGPDSLATVTSGSWLRGWIIRFATGSASSSKPIYSAVRKPPSSDR